MKNSFHIKNVCRFNQLKIGEVGQILLTHTALSDISVTLGPVNIDQAHVSRESSFQQIIAFIPHN